jgi:hypothetical protein
MYEGPAAMWTRVFENQYTQENVNLNLYAGQVQAHRCFGVLSCAEVTDSYRTQTRLAAYLILQIWNVCRSWLALGFSDSLQVQKDTWFEYCKLIIWSTFFISYVWRFPIQTEMKLESANASTCRKRH